MGQVIAYDSSVFIYLLENHPVYAESAERELERMEAKGAKGLFSWIGVLEVLTGPKQAGEQALLEEYRSFFLSQPSLDLVVVDQLISEIASDLRAQYKIATPDAIHLATAIAGEADCFVTNDRKLQQVREIKVALLEHV